MKLVRIVLCYGVLAGLSGTVLADSSWLLLSHQSGEDTVVVPVGGALRTVATPDRVASYGESGRVLGFLSYEMLLARHVLTIVDKPTQEVTNSVLINMDASVIPVRWMSGPILNLVLTDRFAYFASSNPG